MTPTKPLPWFPLDADEWINRTQLLSLEAAGALLVAVLAAWNAPARGDAPGTLPAADEAMARLLGPAWRRVMPVIREHFLEDPDNPTRLRCEWLIALHAAQLAKHESAVDRGRRGGWPKGKPRGKSNSPAIAQLSSSSTERDPRRGAPSEPPIRGGGDASAGHGVATAASPPNATPSDPPVLSTDAVLAWAEEHPAAQREAERAVDEHLDSLNPKWRHSAWAAAVRTRHVTARLTEAFVRERPRIPVGMPPSTGISPGAAHA